MDTTVIIPTLAEHSRSDAIKRCIHSIRGSSNARTLVIVVVNSDRFDDAVCKWLRAQPDVVLEKIATPSAPAAVRHGRGLVETDFFSTIDDDDEYLPGSSDLKLSFLRSKPEADFLVANGYRRAHNIEALLYSKSELSRVATDPLGSLLRSAWLNSCNALYRSASVPVSFFEDHHPYAEWTWIGYKLVLSRRIAVSLDKPCFRVNVTPGSLSQSDLYRISYIKLFERMLALSPPQEVQRLLQAKQSAAWHDLSELSLSRGRRLEAMTRHLRSLLLPGGMRYLTYTRHLFYLGRSGD